MTKKAKDVLDAIKAFYKKFKKYPTNIELARFIGESPATTSIYVIKELEPEGLVERKVYNEDIEYTRKTKYKKKVKRIIIK